MEIEVTTGSVITPTSEAQERLRKIAILRKRVERHNEKRNAFVEQLNKWDEMEMKPLVREIEFHQVMLKQFCADSITPQKKSVDLISARLSITKGRESIIVDDAAILALPNYIWGELEQKGIIKAVTKHSVLKTELRKALDAKNGLTETTREAVLPLFSIEVGEDTFKIAFTDEEALAEQPQLCHIPEYPVEITELTNDGN